MNSTNARSTPTKASPLRSIQQAVIRGGPAHRADVGDPARHSLTQAFFEAPVIESLGRAHAVETPLSRLRAAPAHGRPGGRRHPHRPARRDWLHPRLPSRRRRDPAHRRPHRPLSPTTSTSPRSMARSVPRSRTKPSRLRPGASARLCSPPTSRRARSPSKACALWWTQASPASRASIRSSALRASRPCASPSPTPTSGRGRAGRTRAGRCATASGAKPRCAALRLSPARDRQRRPHRPRARRRPLGRKVSRRPALAEPATRSAVAPCARRVLTHGGAMSADGELTCTGRQAPRRPRLPPRPCADGATRLRTRGSSTRRGHRRPDRASANSAAAPPMSTNASPASEMRTASAPAPCAISQNAGPDRQAAAILRRQRRRGPSPLAFPERIAKSRGGAPGRFVLSGGRGVMLDETDPLAREQWLSGCRHDRLRPDLRITLRRPPRRR